MGDVGWEDARDAGQAQPVPCSPPKSLCRAEIPARNRARISMALGAPQLQGLPGCGEGKAGQGSRGRAITSRAGGCDTGMEGGKDQPGDPKHLGEPGHHPRPPSGFC